MSKNEKRKTKNSSRRKPAGDTPRAKAGSRALSSEQKTPSRSYAKPPLSPIPSGIRDSRNATQRKKPDDALLRERDFSDAIINSLPGTFYIYNEQGTMVRWNRKAIDITEYPAHRLARLHPLDFFEGEDRAQVCPFLHHTLCSTTMAE